MIVLVLRTTIYYDQITRYYDSTGVLCTSYHIIIFAHDTANDV